MSFRAVIVGRPNVGKSTLFNRLVGRRLALVDNQPGVTRDRREGQANIGGLKFTLVDTAGFGDSEAGELTAGMRAQTQSAVNEADVCLFVIDMREGVSPADMDFARWIRRSGRPVILLANKTESPAAAKRVDEAYELGFGEPVAISAEHGEGLQDLYEALERFGTPSPGTEEVLPEEDRDQRDRPLKLAIVGQPNAGKSTLVNALLGQERMVTGTHPGTTRDAIASDWRFRERPIRLWDTAGLRKKARVKDKLEKLSVADALRAIRFSDVVVLLMDATVPFEKQDLQIADLVAKEGRALVIALSKWDLVTQKNFRRQELQRDLDHSLSQIKGVPLVALSALRGEGLDRLMDEVLNVHRIWSTRIPTPALNRWLESVVERHAPPAPGGRRIKIRYMTQSAVRPPTFVAFSSKAEDLPETYVRYLVNGLRQDFGLQGVPIRVHVRQGKNPYAPKSERRRHRS